MSARNPRKLGFSIDRVTPEIAPATPLARIQAAWAEAAGPQVVANAAPVSLRDDVLVVVCSTSAWAQELEMMQVELGRALRERLDPDDRIVGFRFRVGEVG